MIKETEKYRTIFELEAKEIIQKSEEILLKIEKDGVSPELLNELFRHIHTLKGSSASMGEKEIEEILHMLEDKLEKIRKTKKPHLDVQEIFNSIDMIKSLLKGQKPNLYSLEIFLHPDIPLKGARAFVIINNIKKYAEIKKSEPDMESIQNGEFNISFRLLIISNEDELKKVKELIDSFSDVEYFKITPSVEKIKKEEGKEQEIREIKIRAERIDRIINYMGEILIEKDRLKPLIQQSEEKNLRVSFENFESMLSLLQDEIVNLRLVPVKAILGFLPRYIRDEAKKLGKNIEIEIQGEDIEVDRIILEKLKDPLLHLIRNSIGHGIESPEERKRKGKNPEGKISIVVKKEKGTIFINVKDDGAGIKREKVIKKAMESGILKEEEIPGLDEERIMEILTSPSFSTKSEADELSGRGIGLNAVRETLIKLGGDFRIQSEEGKGTEITLRIPVSLAIIKAVILKGGKEKYILPLNYVQGIYNVKNMNMFYLKKRKFIVLGKKLYPVFEFNDLLGLKENGEVLKEALVIEGENKNFAILCEKIVAQQDVFVKNLDETVMKIPYVTGVTILEDGKPYLIIDPISIVTKGEK